MGHDEPNCRQPLTVLQRCRNDHVPLARDSCPLLKDLYVQVVSLSAKTWHFLRCLARGMSDAAVIGLAVMAAAQQV
jgi:hypothetical protein